MSITTVNRFAGGTEPHIATQAAGNFLIHSQLGGDRVDFGGASTGTVLNAATTGVLGTWISTIDRFEIVFAVAYSTNAGTRRFRVCAKDANATAGIVVLPGIWQPENTTIGNAVVPLLDTNYFHAEAITIPAIGWKEMTLFLIDDGLTTPAVKAWAGLK